MRGSHNVSTNKVSRCILHITDRDIALPSISSITMKLSWLPAVPL